MCIGTTAGCPSTPPSSTQGVMIYNGCPSRPTNGCGSSGWNYGAVSIQGGSNVTLTSLTTDQSKVYGGILVFQDRNDTHPVNVSGNSGISACYLGTIYAPQSSNVTLGAGQATMRVQSVVAQQVSISGQAKVTVGAVSCS